MWPVELTAGSGGGGGAGAKPYDSEKAWFSINHSIFPPIYLSQSEVDDPHSVYTCKQNSDSDSPYHL